MPARDLWLPPPVDDPFVDLEQLVLALPPAELEAFAARLDPDDLSLLEAAIQRVTASGWRAHPAAMAQFLDPTYRRPPYVDLLSTKFREAADGVSTRQIWNLPGRYGKSTLIQWGATWLYDRTEGRARLILVSYGQALANELADGVRERLRQHASVLRTQLRRDRQAINRFVTDHDGGLLAAGINASITGFGANALGGIVIDDPFKNWQEAHSASRREHVWNQYRGTIRNRLDEEAGFIIVVHHRVHEEDLTAKLLAEQGKDEFGDEWDLVSLPALAVENDPLGREPGEPLDPERPVEDVKRRAAGLGSYLAAALEQQNPSPEEGNEILRAWFRIDGDDQRPTAPDDACTSWDLKMKDKESGDYVVGQAWWRVAGGYWLMDQIRGQYDHATTANAIALLSVRRPEIKTHVVEYAASAPEVIAELRKKRPRYEVSDEMASRLGMNELERAAVQAVRRRGMSGLVPKKVVEGSKSVRARTYIAPNAEAGDVHLLESSPFLSKLLDELAAFPNGSHDDQVDAMSQALQRLSTGQGSATVPTGSVPRATPAGGRASTRIPRGAAAAGRRRT